MVILISWSTNFVNQDLLKDYKNIFLRCRWKNRSKKMLSTFLELFVCRSPKSLMFTGVERVFRNFFWMLYQKWMMSNNGKQGALGDLGVQSKTYSLETFFGCSTKNGGCPIMVNRGIWVIWESSPYP